MQPSTAKQRASGDGLLSKFKNLDAAVKDLQPHVNEVIEAAKRTADLKQAKYETQEANQRLQNVQNTLSKLRSVNDEALFAYVQTKKDLERKNSDLERRLASLRESHEREYHKKVENLAEQLESEERKSKELASELQQAQMHLQLTKGFLQDTEGKLGRLRKEIGWGTEDSTM